MKATLMRNNYTHITIPYAHTHTFIITSSSSSGSCDGCSLQSADKLRSQFKDENEKKREMLRGGEQLN